MRTAVIGTGIMGHGIALILAKAGYEVVFWGHNQAHLDSGVEIIKTRLDKMVRKEIIGEEEKKAIFERVNPTLDMEEVRGSEFVIEAVVENLKVKQNIFAKLSDIAPDAILATNTSSLSIDKIASFCKKPENVIGMHFFNPPYIMKLLEIVKSPRTADKTYERTAALAERLGKTYVTVKDTPGFIANRLLMPYVNDAIWLIHRGIANKEDIDTVAKLGFNHPMGPIALADFIGLDVTLDILNVIYKETKDEKYRPCPLLEEKVKKGELGRKNGKGFYEY